MAAAVAAGGKHGVIEGTNLVVAQSGFGGLWTLIAQSGPVALFVLLVLLGFSVASWAIIYQKSRQFREVRSQSKQFYREFSQSESLSDIYRQCERFPRSTLAGVFKSAYQELNQQVESPSENPGRLVIRSLEGVRRSVQRAAALELTTLEGSLGWLATTATVTPFIGLLGTVIGIINAFQGLGEGSATTIQAVAPGISEALVATAAGLFAAIPAVIGYNHLLRQLKILGAELDDFCAEFLNLIERSFT